MNVRTLVSAAAGLLLGMHASAAVVTYDFDTSLGNGSFSYEDTNVTTKPTPPGFAPGGAWYDALSFSFDGVVVADAVVGVYDDFTGSLDCLLVTSASTSPNPSLTLCGATSLWSGTQVSNLNGRTAGDFGTSEYRNAQGNVGFFLRSLTERTTQVPEPSGLALLGLGLAAFAVSRKRKP